MIVLCLQFFQDDKPQAMRLARLIADIEPIRRDDVEIVFVARFGCEHDKGTAAYVAEKFPVTFLTTTRRWTGWPGGCNGMALDVLEWVAKERPDALGVLLLEGDCVPLSRTWLKQIVGHWMLAMLDGAWCMGSWRNSGGLDGHLNGCMMVRPDFAKLVDMSVVSPHLAWDCAIVPQTKDHWCRSGLFLNKFQSTGATEEALRTPEIGGVPPVIAHGFKDDSAYDIARKWLLP